MLLSSKQVVFLIHPSVDLTVALGRDRPLVDLLEA
jgi:hypothetical protein